MSRLVRVIGNHHVVEYRPAGVKPESRAFVLFAWESDVVASRRPKVIAENDVVGLKVGSWFFWSAEDPSVSSAISVHYGAKIATEWGYEHRDHHKPFRESFFRLARNRLGGPLSDRLKGQKGSIPDYPETLKFDDIPKWLRDLGEGNLYQPQQFGDEVKWMKVAREAKATMLVALDEAIEMVDKERSTLRAPDNLKGLSGDDRLYSRFRRRKFQK